MTGTLIAVVVPIGMFLLTRPGMAGRDDTSSPVPPTDAPSLAMALSYDAAPAVVLAPTETPMPPTDGPTAAPTDPPTVDPFFTPSITPTPEPSLTPTPPVEAGYPIIPAIDGGMKGRLREVHQRGQERGMRPNVFMKVGDSISVSGYFMTDIGCGRVNLGAYPELAPVIEHFRAAELPADVSDARCGASNAFTRRSFSTERGWTAADPLVAGDLPAHLCAEPDNTPLRCEVRRIQPGVALIMLGTNDVHQGIGLGRYEANLGRIVDELLERGVVPVLSTIPHRTDWRSAADRVGLYNEVIINVAAQRQIPLLNYWLALQGPDMQRAGMEPDGIHPNAHGYGTSFTERGLRYGYNQRNLTALQMLEKVKRIVFDDQAPD